jgi:hypothetical protein
MAISIGKPAFYRLAGQDIFVDQEIPESGPFRSEGQDLPNPQIPIHLTRMAEHAPAARIEGWLADRILTVSLWRDGFGTLMEIPTAGHFWTAADGKAITQVSQAPDSDPGFQAEALLGPPLVLALALRDRWCLHASAALFHDCLVAFLAESGGGKSTLARYLGECPGWKLVADDILPVSLGRDGVAAWPRFPQLKLPRAEQPGQHLPEEMPLGKICVLMNSNLDKRPALERLAVSQSVQMLLAHTAGARLFDPGLLEKHLSFCVEAAGRVEVYQLRYPRRMEALPEVKQVLEGICREWNGIRRD